jgi:hypothetical protein
MLKGSALLFVFTAVPVLMVHSIPHLAGVFACSCFFLGYAGHLLADSVTRAGLPG